MKSCLSWCKSIICCLIFIMFTEITSAIPSQKDDTILVEAKIFTVKPSNEGFINYHFDFGKNMPWIAVLLIGISTVFTNLYISKKSRISNLAVIERQISNAQNIALDQIEQSRLNSERDFNKTVVTGSRQIWINNLRDFISNILALNSKFLMYQTISDDDANELWLQVAKVELLLIASDYGNLVKIVKDIEHCCKEVQMGNQTYESIGEMLPILKEQASIVFREEWQKIKSGS